MRGKHLPNAGLNLWPCLIPACAGKTPTSPLPTNGPPAHPRACGENPSKSPSKHFTMGSSPRVRGKRIPPRRNRSIPGLIPACAGKTASSPVILEELGAHPRVCGENASVTYLTRTFLGSSPRVRGKLAVVRDDDRLARLIPACAGKTRDIVLAVSPVQAHPRVCGENVSALPLLTVLTGSSPRVRGKPVEHVAGHAGCRLIPACAGKTNSWFQG